MSRSPTDSPNLVDKVLARQPFEKASSAAALLRDQVRRSVCTSYRTCIPEDVVETPMFVSCFAFAATLLGGLALGGAGYFPFAATCFAAIPIEIFGPLVYLQYKYLPVPRFKEVCGELHVAAAVLPAAARTRLQEFGEIAWRTLVLAQISVVQEEISSSRDATSRRLHRLERKGIILIDEASEKLGISDLERRKLQVAFKAGQLPKPQEYIAALDVDCARTQSIVDAVLLEKTLAR